jgi:hypothetical protein
MSIKHPSQKQCLDLNTCWQVLNQRVIFVLTELNSDVMSHNFYTLSDPYPNVFHISLCIIQSTLPFQGEIFPVLYNPLYHFREIFPVLPCIIQSTLSFQRDISCIALYYTIHSIISGRYLLITLYYTIHSIIS